MEDYLIHYRTPGSKNGVRKYQYKDGSLTPAGKLRYLKGGIKGTNIGPEYEQELEFNSQQNIYPSNEPKPKSNSKRSRVSKIDQINKKIEKRGPITDPDDYYGPNSYKHVEGEIPQKIRAPYSRDYTTKARNNIFNRMKKQINKHIRSFFEKSFDKHFINIMNPPKGSDLINHLLPYTNKEAAEALLAYTNAKSSGNFGDHINTFIQTAQMNIANGCARFLDSIGMDDEVYRFLKKLGVKDNNDYLK